ncbi:dickkopf-related protein 4 [Ornithorhynchus anatinus]|uniref:Dickkopf WNT signaling pathway inhibitor 4 n=1 Tax=Ornithorhynchus anatinus TaxID=9258 RepID=F7CGZ1_ORNAN|nr:dickkopf-related protein 4 [Ornithorhynchus anatinus]
MVVAFLLGLSWLCSPSAALVLDSNIIKSSAEVQATRKGSQCSIDRDCTVRKFCLKPRDEMAFCATCRGLRRRCHRNAMCCPGTVCVNDVCTLAEEIPLLERRLDDQDGLILKVTTQHPIQENKPRRKSNPNKSQGSKGQEGESCLRTFDCSPGLCCARHFWTKICKPVLMEGQVCSRRGHKDVQGPEIFQRCDCGPGLSCRNQNTGTPHQTRLRVCQKI